MTCPDLDFAYRLAWNCGELDPVEMLRTKITAKQFNRWKTWYKLEPRDEERADLQIATMTAILRNQTASEPATISDILFAIRDVWDPPTEKDLEARAEAKRKAKREQSRRKFISMGKKAKLNGK